MVKEAKNKAKPAKKAVQKQKNVVKKQVQDDHAKGVDEFTKAAFMRALHRAGAKRVSYTVFDSLRAHTLSRLNSLLRKMIVCMDYERRKTLYSKDLKEAVESTGRSLYASVPDVFKKKRGEAHEKDADSQKAKAAVAKRRTRPGVMALKKIKEQQQSEEFCFPKTVFERVCRYIASQFKDNVKFSASVFYLLQLSVEEELVTLCRKANAIALDQNRETLFDRDFKFVQYLENL